MRILQFIIVLAIWMLSMGSGLSYGAQLPELKISWHKDSLQGKERVSLSVRNDSVILAWTEDSSYRYKLDNTEIGKVKKLLQGKHLLSTDTVTFQWPDFPRTMEICDYKLAQTIDREKLVNALCIDLQSLLPMHIDLCSEYGTYNYGELIVSPNPNYQPPADQKWHEIRLGSGASSLNPDYFDDQIITISDGILTYSSFLTKENETRPLTEAELTRLNVLMSRIDIDAYYCFLLAMCDVSGFVLSVNGERVAISSPKSFTGTAPELYGALCRYIWKLSGKREFLYSP